VPVGGFTATSIVTDTACVGIYCVTSTLIGRWRSEESPAWAENANPKITQIKVIQEIRFFVIGHPAFIDSRSYGRESVGYVLVTTPAFDQLQCLETL
jgi:hypothetical protein